MKNLFKNHRWDALTVVYDGYVPGGRDAYQGRDSYHVVYRATKHGQTTCYVVYKLTWKGGLIGRSILE